MNEARLEMEFVTPCFLGGADPTRTAEWRSASVRGQLRWWFRAVAGGAYAGDLERVRTAERKVFGDTGQASALQIVAGGQPKTTTTSEIPWRDRRLNEVELARLWGLEPGHSEWSPTLDRLKLVLPGGRSARSSPIQYLGYGCIGFKDLERACILPREKVLLRFQWRDTKKGVLEGEHWKFFARALWCWLHLGGIGAKSRKGFGSLVAIGIEGELLTSSQEGLVFKGAALEQFEAGAKVVLSESAEGTRSPCEWTHFFQGSQIFISTQLFGTWDEAMTHIGAWLIGFRRRYGCPREVRFRNGHKLGNRDYVWASPSAEDGPEFRKGFPDRSGFGLPLPFEKKDKNTGKVRGETVNWNGARDDDTGEHRRAAPLLVHIGCFGERKYAPVLTYLPARWLPAGARLTFRRGPQRAVPNAEQKDVIPHFLEDLESKHLIREVKP